MTAVALTRPPRQTLVDDAVSNIADALTWQMRVGKINEALKTGGLHAAMGWAGSEHGAELIWQVYERFECSKVADALILAWTICHAPLAKLSARHWVRMFKAAGFVTDGPAQPSEPVTAYRAAECWTNGWGLAWTLDRSVADTFCERRNAAGLPSRVYEVVAQPRTVLARFDGREESEVVLNAFMIRHLIRVAGEDSHATTS